MVDFVGSTASPAIGSLVLELAGKFHFDLERPGYILWVKTPEAIDQKTSSKLRVRPGGDLVVAVGSDEYILGLSLPQGAGFRVFYSMDWVPLRAINENGCPYRNLASANRQMCLLVRCYLDSERSIVTPLL
jgi:hypothetical protein